MRPAPLLLLILLCLTPAAWGQSPFTYKMSQPDMTKLERAVQDYNTHRYRPSTVALLALTERYPENPDLYFYLGLNAVKRNFNVAGIRRYFPKVLKLNPNYPNAVAHYYMGLIHYTDEEYDLAEEDFKRYFELANSAGTPESDAIYMEASNYLYWTTFLAEAYRNRAPFDPHVVPGLSTAEDEAMPFITHDGAHCYLLRTTSTASPTSFYSHELEQKPLQLYQSDRRDTLFGPARLLKAPFNQGDPEGGVTLTADNRELYYPVIRRFRGYNNSDIYFTRPDSNGWQPIANAGDNVNAPDSWESQPSISADGQWLYFASNRKGGLGGTDIWRCPRKADGTWGKAQNLGSAVNTPGNERCPFIHADGHALYFSSNGWQGFGGYDLYFTDLDNAEQSKPINLGLPLNTEEDDIALNVIPAGTHAYYAGRTASPDRMGGQDVLMFELYNAARPEGMTLFRGTVLTPDGKPANAVIAVEHGTQSPALYHTDPQGRYTVLLSTVKANTVTVSAPGCRNATFTLPARTGATPALPSTITLQRP